MGAPVQKIAFTAYYDKRSQGWEMLRAALLILIRGELQVRMVPEVIAIDGKEMRNEDVILNTTNESPV